MKRVLLLSAIALLAATSVEAQEVAEAPVVSDSVVVEANEGSSITFSGFYGVGYVVSTEDGYSELEPQIGINAEFGVNSVNLGVYQPMPFGDYDTPKPVLFIGFFRSF